MAHENGLKLIDRDSVKTTRPAACWPAVAWTVTILGAAALATGLGAGPARRIPDARKEAQAISQIAMKHGSDDPRVRRRLTQLRRRLVRAPLDSRTRAAYAGLLLGLSRSVEDMEAAAHHARRAAELSPVTVSNVATAVIVLSRAGYIDESLALVRDMFLYDREAAARYLAQIESLLPRDSLESGIPAVPSAWLAWAHQLRRDGRVDEARRRVEQAHLRWPDDLDTLQQIAARLVGANDWSGLAALFPDGRRFPETLAAAPVLLYRARLKAFRSDGNGARADIERAVRLDTVTVTTPLLAGEAFLALGDVDRARRSWSRALFRASGSGMARARLLVHLARLEDRHGKPAAALRHWEQLLELQPDHLEARRRVAELGGVQR